MSFIYCISDNHKSFKFKRKVYRTPCTVTITNLAENKMLRDVLLKAGINNIKVKKSKNLRKRSNKVDLGLGDGTVALHSIIRG